MIIKVNDLLNEKKPETNHCGERRGTG